LNGWIAALAKRLFHVEQIILPVGEIRNRLVSRLGFGLGEVN